MRRAAAAGALSLLLPSVALATPPRFAAPFLSYPLPFGGAAIEVADLDGDGRPDVLTAREGAVDVLLGSADGTFTPGDPAPGGFVPFLADAFAIGDLNGDGRMDYVVAMDSLRIGVALGDGSAHFAPLVPYPVAKAPVALVVADFNGDHVPDVASLSTRATLVSVLLGAGDGTLTPTSSVATGPAPWSLCAADIDQDGDIDLLVGNRGDATLSRLLGDGAGQFTPTAPVALPGAPSRIAVTALNGDALPDLVVGGLSAAELYVLTGSGGGGFAPAQVVGMPGISTDVVVTDLDGDGRPDLVAAMYERDSFAVRLGLGGLGFGPPSEWTTPRSPTALVAVDVNGGGKPDLVVLGGFGFLSVHMGNGDGTFGGQVARTVGDQPTGVAVGDLDEDGVPDLVTVNRGTGTLSIATGAGDGTFGTPVALPAGVEPHGITLADLNGDHHLDLVVANHGPGFQSFSIVSVFLGDGALGFGPRTDYQVGRWCEQVAVGDVNGDGLVDLAVATDDFTSTLTVLEGIGGGGFGNRHDSSIGSNATSVAIGDVTRDGKPDIVLGGYAVNTVYLVRGLGHGAFLPPEGFTLPGSPTGTPLGVAVADMDGDGFDDIVAGHAAVTVIRSLPGGAFAPLETYPAGGGPLAIADFDGDHRLDVATANSLPSNSLTVLYGQAGGALAGRTDLGCGAQPGALAAADVDGDGWVDLLGANLRASTVSVLLNTRGLVWLPWAGASPPPPGPMVLSARPNPARGDLRLDFVLAKAGHVSLRLYDLTGRLLTTLADADSPAGPQHATWSRADRSRDGAAAGVCFAELVAGGERRVRRVVLLP